VSAPTAADRRDAVDAARRAGVDAARRAGALVDASLRGDSLKGPVLHDGAVVGIGVDAVDVVRFRGILARRPGFAARFFTDTEQADARRAPDPAESLAARFAAKAAVMKALGTGLGGFALTEVEVHRGSGSGATAGAPSLVLHGSAAALAARCQVGRFHLSLTHTTELALAFVVAERSVPCSLS
jgi:holo-[acyl-carrier protein] synthase